MKKFIVRFTPIATAVGLALGTASVLAQQPGAEPQGRSAIDQRSDAQDQFEREDALEENRADRSEEPARQEPARQEQSSDKADSDFDQLAEENSDLSKFVEGVKTAGLEDALSSGPQYTIFAPTDDALESADYDSLLQPENRQDLIALLRAHIVADDVDQELAGNISQARTIDGGTLDISMQDEKLMVGDAEATEADGFDIGNLRVYKVDQVLGEGMPGEAGRRQAANRQSPSDRSAFGDDAPESGNRDLQR
jgi:uncharacterized surface protein with fasciclin (FAS1) repeats